MEAMLEETAIARYDAYKDSGVEWLGEIPEHWELTRLGTRFIERRSKVSDKDYSPLSVTKNGILPQLDNAAKTNDGDNRKLVKKGDFVINSRSDRKGSSGIAYEDGSVSLINIVMEPNQIQPTYCNYLLKCHSFIEEYYRMGHGIVADLWTTRYDEMRNIKLAIPPTKEQTAIANFLDDKTAKIDRAISIKQKQIELLKERRQILIHNAVTHGLDPNVEMKDSGVEWIGEVPKHWELNKNKILFSESKRYGGDELPILSVSIHSAVSSEEIDDEDNIRGRVKIDDKSAYKVVIPNDIVFNMMRAWQGSIGAVAVDGLVSPAYVVATPVKKINSKYFEFLYRTAIYIDEMNKNSKGIADFRKRLYWEEFKQMITIVPPSNEQVRIVQYINNTYDKTDCAISLLVKEIDRLKEYKASLVNSVVTGKVKVT